MELRSFDIASLEGFRADLVGSGFEPVPTTEHSLWKGPIHPAFDGLTDEQTMVIALGEGWPYQPPGVFVQGLNTNHCMLNGFVCLWRVGDASRQWETVSGLFSRIEDWCARAKNGWQDDDLPFDAYLNFCRKYPMLATFDFGTLRTGIRKRGDLHGILMTDPLILNIRPGPVSSPEELRGLWFRVGQLQHPPPRDFSELHGHLNRGAPERFGKGSLTAPQSPTFSSQAAAWISFCLHGSDGSARICLSWLWKEKGKAWKPKC